MFWTNSLIWSSRLLLWFAPIAPAEVTAEVPAGRPASSISAAISGEIAGEIPARKSRSRAGPPAASGNWKMGGEPDRGIWASPRRTDSSHLLNSVCRWSSSA